jgi:hypothetical protein
MAEAYLMKNDFENAMQIISRVKDGIGVPKNNSERRWLSRAIIMEASIPLMTHKGDWANDSRKILEPVLIEDTRYYYAAATLGQIYLSLKNSVRAKELFKMAYDSITTSNELVASTEARVKVHLLMVAGLCCMKGMIDSKTAAEHLDKASALLGDLPIIGSVKCTVFSNLSKRNEEVDVIRKHIELIRNGEFFS